MLKIRKVGQPPGTLVYTGQKSKAKVTIEVIDYNATEIFENPDATLEELSDCKLRQTVKWININGLHDDKVIQQIGDLFGIHHLVLEDIMNTDQRPKVDHFEEYIFVVIKMLNYNPKVDNFESEQMSLIFGKDFVLSFQEEAGDDFNPVRERLRHNSRLRASNADHLAYSIVDLIVDSYFHVLDKMGDWLEDLEDEIIRRPHVRKTIEIKELRRDINFLRKNIWPVRELINSIVRHDEGIVEKETMVYFRDIYDHVVQVLDTIDTYRDMVTTLMDLYLSNISYKMNEVMKILTIIATIFIPITFITSLFGMNFKMPEWLIEYGFVITVAFCIIICVWMLMYFRKMKWL